MKCVWLSPLIMLPSLLVASDGATEINGANTAWMIVATALVMLMTPAGLALFYGGMTRSKNMLNTMAMSVMGYILASLVWVGWAYGLAFGEDIGGWIGKLTALFLSNISVKDLLDGVGIPTLIFVAFQMTFAGITVAIASGSLIERLKFSTWILFVILWITFVYAPVAHWVWGGGFLSKDGVLDFAGGTVVHINAGVAGLVVAYMLGKRESYGRAFFPSSAALTMLGAILLWFGWFGFNGGSGLAVDGIAANAFIVTNTAAAAGALGWLCVEYLLYKRFTIIGIASGIIAGLVAITPAAGFVNNSAAIIIGATGGMVAFYAINSLKKRLKCDDSLDAFGIHGIAGIWGALLTGIFANPAINEAGCGLLYGNPAQLLLQIKGVVVTIIFTAIATAIIFKIVSLLTGGGRVSPQEETKGLDESIHGEQSFYLK